jgi:hypothetical protein
MIMLRCLAGSETLNAYVVKYPEMTKSLIHASRVAIEKCVKYILRTIKKMTQRSGLRIATRSIKLIFE